MKLFGGSANLQLSQEVAQLLSIPVAKSEFTRFDDSEIKVTIQEDVKDQECVVIQTTSNPTDTHYMELIFFADALKRSEAKHLTAIIPYFGYSRQNMQHRPGECVSLNVIIRMLELVGYNKVITFDFHEPASADMFTIPFEAPSALPFLAKHMQKKLTDVSAQNTVVVASDDDVGVERAQLFAKHLFNTDNIEVGMVEKQRNLDKIHESKAIKLFAQVKNKKVILVDDVVTSGGTLINAANICLENGASEVYAVVTHADFSPSAPQKLQESNIKILLTANTIPVAENNMFDKLKTISIAELIRSIINNDK